MFWITAPSFSSLYVLYSESLISRYNQELQLHKILYFYLNI